MYGLAYSTTCMIRNTRNNSKRYKNYIICSSEYFYTRKVAYAYLWTRCNIS